MRRKPSNEPARPIVSRLHVVVIALGIFCVTVAIYLPAMWCEWVDYDDKAFITKNEIVCNGLTWGGFVWAWSIHGPSQWHPLTWLSHMLDAELFGLTPAAHHAVNVLIHSGSSVLLYALLVVTTGAPWRSALVAAIFAWHPAHVESVAWVSERKDVLCALFVFVTLLAYVVYVRRPSVMRYAVVVLAFALALMSKPMAATLPVLMLLLDVWPLERFSRGRRHGMNPDAMAPVVRRALIDKLPLLAMAGAAVWLSFLCQLDAGTVSSIEDVSVQSRLTAPLVAYVRYLRLAMLPVNMSVLYPLENDPPLWQWAGSMLVLVAITAMIIRSRRPYAVVGWLWFMISLLPVIGILHVGAQSIADRYTYLPYVGLSIVVSWAADEVAQWSASAKRVIVGVVATLLALACVMVPTQLRHWRNPQTLFEQALRVTKDNDIMHFNLGRWYDDHDNVEAAVDQYAKAVEIRPGFAKAQLNLGAGLQVLGDLRQAETHLRAAIELDPELAGAHLSLGRLLAVTGRLDEAVASLKRGIELRPAEVLGRVQLAVLFQQRGDRAQAIALVEEALRLDPNDDLAQAAMRDLAGPSPTATPN